MEKDNELDSFVETSEEVQNTEDSTVEEKETATDGKTGTEQADDKGENAETPSAEDKESSAKTDEGKAHWSETAYLDEKRKRQELEKQLEEKSKPKAEEVNLFVDPDGFKKSIKDGIRQENFKTKVNLSREFMLEAKPDYEEKEAKFFEMAQTDSALVTKMQNHSNPARFAYETASKQQALDEIGDPAAYKERLKKEILEELKGSQDKPEETEKPQVDDAPSLATASAAKSNTSINEMSLEDMFDR